MPQPLTELSCELMQTRFFVGERVTKTGDFQRDCASNHNEWEAQMAKSARKRRARRKKSANHGKRPNA